jgi:hypothetical protein
MAGHDAAYRKGDVMNNPGERLTGDVLKNLGAWAK